MGFIPKYDFRIRKKKMKIIKILYALYALILAEHYSEKNDTARTIFYSAQIIVAAIYIVNP